MSTTDLPTPSTSALASTTPPRKRLIDRMPVLSHLRQSVGLQRGMLITGLVITIGFLLIAIFAPLIAPYSWALPRWVLIGVAGLLLLVGGITWEDRVRDGRAVARFVRSMR